MDHSDHSDHSLIAPLQSAAFKFLKDKTAYNLSMVKRATKRMNRDLARTILQMEFDGFKMQKFLVHYKDKSVMERASCIDNIPLPRSGFFLKSSPSGQAAKRLYMEMIKTMQDEAEFVHSTTGSDVFKCLLKQHQILIKLKSKNFILTSQCKRRKRAVTG